MSEAGVGGAHLAAEVCESIALDLGVNGIVPGLAAGAERLELVGVGDACVGWGEQVQVLQVRRRRCAGAGAQAAPAGPPGPISLRTHSGQLLVSSDPWQPRLLTVARAAAHVAPLVRGGCGAAVADLVGRASGWALAELARGGRADALGGDGDSRGRGPERPGRAGEDPVDVGASAVAAAAKAVLKERL
jgi:hypothetical protein